MAEPMSLQQYLAFLGDKVAAAEADKNVAECIRLATVGKATLDEYVAKCRAYEAKENT